MPQDIPVEASDTLDFTPASLAELGDKAPSFTLRAVGSRDKRHLRFLRRAEDIVPYSPKELREEMLVGLERLWSAADYAQHVPILHEWWDASDDFAIQQREYDKTKGPDDPPLEFGFDPAVERACLNLEAELRSAHRPFATKLAHNEQAQSMTPLLFIAVTVSGWTGLDTPIRRERGYLTLDCADDLTEELGRLAYDHALAQGNSEELADALRRLPAMELFVACNKRFQLDRDEEKNSAAPPPSGPIPSASTAGASANGKSPASASSTETPESSSAKSTTTSSGSTNSASEASAE